MYKSELRTIKILSIFSILSLFLSVLGIIGMVLFIVETRKKEIAIRQINGAETKDIILLFVMKFVKIIALSSVLVIPLCIFTLNRWIQTYSFRTSLSWWIFVLIPIAVTMIAAGIISLQVFNATRQNPAEIIKSTA